MKLFVPNATAPSVFLTSHFNLRHLLLLLFLILSGSSPRQVACQSLSCPPVNLIHRLTAPSRTSTASSSPFSNQHNAGQQHPPECDCTAIQEGGWEINCYSNQATPPASSGVLDTSAASPALLDYGIDYNILMVSFTIRYVAGRQVKITCDHGSPVFKPGLFQGFGIESIDTFVISNCDLPLNLPLSVVLHRTAPPATPSNHFTFKMGATEFSINNTHQAEVESTAPIRSLYIASKKPVSVQQLNTLLSDLESLEQLTLSDFALSDVHEHILNADSKGLLPEVFELSHSNRFRRDLENEFQEVAPTTTPLPETPPIVTTTETSVSMKIEKRVDHKTREERVLAIPDMDMRFRPKEEGNDESPPEEVPVTTMTPEMPPVFVESTEMPEITIRNETNSEESESVNIPRLDENWMSLSRLVPNLTVLRLRSFINDPQLPAVFFQVLTNLTKLEYLELESNTINEVPKNALSFAPNLRKLYLFKNSIHSIESDAFANLSKLEILDLSQNKLSTLPDQLLKPLTNLAFLSLRSNDLINLDANTFSANSKLKSLDLSQNVGLEPLPGTLFKSLNSLKNVSLAFCNMSSISDDFGQLLRSVPELTKLDLRSNRLENLTIPGLFAATPKLSKLDVSNNAIRVIAPSVFSSKNNKLSEIYLGKNRLNDLSENLFSPLKNLKILHLDQNELTEINPRMFLPLSELQELNLSRNRIRTLNTHINQLPFGIGANLRSVDLSFNALTDFDEEIGSVNWSLYLTIAEVNVRGNQFSGTLQVPSFSSTLEPVVILDVSSNRFTHVSTRNLLLFEAEDWRALKDQAVSSNSYETHVKIESNPFHCDCFLYAFINYTRQTRRPSQRSLGRRTVFLLDTLSPPTCHEPSELNEAPLSSLRSDQLRCQIDDPRICPESCKCEFRAEDRATVIDCVNRHLQEVPAELVLSQFYNISVREIGGAIISDVDNVEVKLQNNSISDVEPIRRLFEWLNPGAQMPETVSVELDNNEISFLPTNLFPSSEIEKPRIKRFSLTGNELQRIPIEFLKTFSGESETNGTQALVQFVGESKIYLGSNPLDCYNEPAPPEAFCWVRELKHWIASHPRLVGDAAAIKCSNISTFGLPENATELPLDELLVNIADHILCPVLIPEAETAALVALSITCVVLGSSLFVVSVLYYRNKQTILAFIYIHLNPIFICLSFSEDDLDEDKLYDAFVSYSSADRDIVMQLVEKLEDAKELNDFNAFMQNGKTVHEATVDRVVPEYEYRSTLKTAKDLESGVVDQPGKYRLCIHERDWLPGNLISWNIVNSVQNSRRTILILSEQFIQSIWFQVEFHTAYYQMLEDRIDRLIVIVRGELPPRDRLDKDLAYLLTTKTYLVWGEKWFWEKLYYAMPHKKKSPSAAQFGKDARFQEQNKFAVANGMTQKYGAMNGNQKWNSRSETMKDYVDQTIATHFQLNELSSNVMPSPKAEPEAPKAPVRSAPKSLRNSGSLATASSVTREVFSSSGAYENHSFIDETGT